MDLCRLVLFLLLPCLADLQLLCDLVGASDCPLQDTSRTTTPSKDKLCQQLRDYVGCVEHHIAGCTENQSQSYTEAIEHLKSGYQGGTFNCQFETPGGSLFLQGPSHDVVGFINSTVQIYCNVIRRVDRRNSTNTGVFTMYWQFKPWNSSDFTDILTITGLYYYSWDVASVDWTKYNITQGKQLLIHHLDYLDAGIYRCGLKETKQTAQAELFVLGNVKCVNERPVIQLLNASHPPNSLYSCDVNYAGSSAPNLTWYYRDEQLIDKEETVFRELASSLLSFPVTPMDRGKNYRCHLSYDTANWVHTCQPSPSLNINFPVQVTSLVVTPYTKSKYFHKGDKITLYCGATGDPAPHFEWKFRAINSTGFRFLSHYHHHLIAGLGEKTAGAYQCLVYNKIQGHSFQDAKIVDIKLTESETADRRVMPDPDSSRTLKKTTLSPYAIGAMVSAALAVILIFVFIFLAVKLKKRERRMREKLARAHDETLDDQEVELLDENIQPCRDDMPLQYGNLRQNWEVLRNDVRLVDMIGKGSFTEVYKGRMRRRPGEEGTMKVAIKKPAVEATDKEKKFFSAELEVMKMLQSHPNIVHLMGCYTKSEPHLMILEYAAEDTLLNYLQLHRPGKREVSVTISDNDSQAVRLHTKGLTPQKMIHLAAQIIHGLEHLTKFKLVSYRLRAAGILVVRGGICKLSGFGVPQDVLERNVYEAASAPIRWMSPESLSQHVFDTRTDLWAFGVVLWEILHFGVSPYPNMGPHEVAEKVQAGYRMPQPVHCSSDMYKLMLACWSISPEQPPSHDMILQLLEQFATCSSSHVRLEKMPDYLKWMAPIQEESSLDLNGELKC